MYVGEIVLSLINLEGSQEWKVLASKLHVCTVLRCHLQEQFGLRLIANFEWFCKLKVSRTDKKELRTCKFCEY